MKKLLTLFVLIQVAQFSVAQENESLRDRILFEKAKALTEEAHFELNSFAHDHFEDSQHSELQIVKDIQHILLKNALEYYQEIADHFPNSKLFLDAMNNKGVIEMELDKKEDAKKTFTFILNSNADDSLKGGAEAWISGNLYANYKNRAARMLASLAFKENKFREALEYLDLTKKYPYLQFCGNEFASMKQYMTIMYGKCYVGLNDPKKACEILLPEIFDNFIQDNSGLVDLAFRALLMIRSKKELREEYEKAFQHYWKENKNDDKEDSTSDHFILFLGIQIPLKLYYLATTKKTGSAPEYFYLTTPRKEEVPGLIDQKYRSSRLYKLLNE